MAETSEFIDSWQASMGIGWRAIDVAFQYALIRRMSMPGQRGTTIRILQEWGAHGVDQKFRIRQREKLIGMQNSPALMLKESVPLRVVSAKLLGGLA
jgi:hypothetical protein